MRESFVVNVLRVVTIVGLVLGVGSVYAEVIEQHYEFDKYTVSELGDYQLINFDNTMPTGIAGEPALPYHAVAILLPPGEVAGSIEFTGEEETQIPGSFQIYPQQHARPISLKTPAEFVKNVELYQTDAIYPSVATGHLSTEFMNGYSLALSAFTPVKYNPATSKVTYYKRVTLKIHTDPQSKAHSALGNLCSRSDAIERVTGLAQNPETISRYPSVKSSNGDYELLIITPAAYVDSFQVLIDLYAARGIEIQVMTTEDINSSVTGDDLAEKIRNYIIQEYQNYSIQYVLLGGDSNNSGTGLVPHRGFYCYVQSGSGVEVNGMAADLYYSALDGNWNDDGDDRWGEIGEDDLLPEVAVGRLPFGDAGELHNMLHKTVSYQDSPVTGELRQPLLAGEHMWDDPESWGSDYIRLLIGHHEDNGYTTDGIPVDDDIDSLYERYESWGGTTLRSRINNGISFLHHAGHANDTYVMHLYSSDITDPNFYGANGVDHNYVLIITHGCMCGRFNTSDCIAEEMLKIENFCVAGAFNSNYGWFNEGQTEGPAAHIHREFVDALYTDSVDHIGATLMQAKIQTSPWVNAPGQHEEGALRFNFYDCNILGDPVLAIWSAEPIEVQADYIDFVVTNTPSVSVSVNNGRAPVAGLTCTLMKDGILHGKGVTDSQGDVEITVDPPITTGGAGELIVSGYNCLPTTFPITFVEDCCAGVRGNVLLEPNCDPSDQTVDISDLTDLIDHLFIGYTPYCCLEEVDIAPAISGEQADGVVDISDLTALIDHMFISYPPLPPCE